MRATNHDASGFTRDLCIKATVYDLYHVNDCHIPLENPEVLRQYLMEFEDIVVPEFLRYE